jgi:hypothetical protein
MYSFDSNIHVDAVVDITAPPSSPIEPLGELNFLKQLQSRAVALLRWLWSGEARSTDRLLNALPSKPLSNSTDILFEVHLKVAPRAIRDPISKAYIIATFGYRFTNLDLLDEAFDASSVYPDRPDSNKRMAVIGDKVIDLILQSDWFPTGQPKGKQIATRTCISMIRLT